MKQEQEVRRFELHWKDNKIEIIEGPNLGKTFPTLVNAMTMAGYGAGALPALDYWKELGVKNESRT